MAAPRARTCPQACRSPGLFMPEHLHAGDTTGHGIAQLYPSWPSSRPSPRVWIFIARWPSPWPSDRNLGLELVGYRSPRSHSLQRGPLLPTVARRLFLFKPRAPARKPAREFERGPPRAQRNLRGQQCFLGSRQKIRQTINCILDKSIRPQ